MNRTRIVRWLRVLLPLLALAILSTLFLFSRKPGSEPPIPYTEVEPGAIGSSQLITAPAYSSVTDDGAAITLRADQAVPVGDNGASGAGATGLRLTWRARDGLAADLAAPDAAVSDGQVTLSGGVRMTMSSGWVLTAPEFVADTVESVIEAPQKVNALAPFGRLTAGNMTLRRDGQPDGKDDHVLNFSGGVRLLYQP